MSYISGPSDRSGRPWRRPSRTTSSNPSPPGYPLEPLVPTGPPRPGPDPVAELVRRERARREAEALGDRRLATQRLADVVSTLDDILVAARTRIEDADRPELRARSSAAASDEAMTTLARIPLEQVSDILGLPTAVVPEVITRLRENGGVRPDERRAALHEIDMLRGRLREIQPEEPSRLQAIIRRVLRIAVAVSAAAAAGALAAATVSDDVLVDLVKAGVAALVTLALAVGEERILAYRRRIDPARETEVRRDELLTALDDLIEIERHPESAYQGERTITRIRAVLAVHAGRMASAGVAWAGSEEYRQVLDGVVIEMDGVRDGRDARLSILRRRLAAAPLPGRRPPGSRR